MLTAARCRVSGESKRNYRANAQQTRRGCDARMHVHRSRASMKSRIRQIYLGQNQNQCDEHKPGQQEEQTRRIDRPASHGTDGNTKSGCVKPHESAMCLRWWIVESRQPTVTPPAARSCWRHPESARHNVPMRPASAGFSTPPRQQRDSPAQSRSTVPRQRVRRPDRSPRPSHR